MKKNYFSIEEFTHSDTAIKMGYDNSMPEELIPNFIKLRDNILNPTRNYLGIPIYINSGYRDRETTNKAVGGVPTSHHCFGMAADLSCSSNLKLFNYIKDNLEFTQLIKYPNFVHVSYNENDLRNQIIIK